MKKKYQFAGPGPYTLQLSYSRLAVDENGRAEVDTNDAAMMRLVAHFGGKAVEDDPQKEKTAKADGSETELKATKKPKDKD